MSSRKLVSGVVLGAIVTLLFMFGGGCLTRPVVAGNPVTKTNFTVGYSTTTINKIDILFDIDNSSSMGDKQQYLQAAVPDLITRLVSPNCVDANGNNLTDANGVQLVAATDGTCAMGQAEFPPVHDMHIGVITSSLGGRGTTSICQVSTTPNAVADEYEEYTSGSYMQYLTDSANMNWAGLSSISKNNDDQAHLINRTDPPADPNDPTTTIAGNFLAWVPPMSNDTAPVNGVSESTVGTPTAGEYPTGTLVGDFQELVVGTQAYGCGIESQLETWYRFLVQPDPYQSITTTTNNNGLLVASWQGVDNVILQQRADFLRPDSLVLIVVLSDEDDSEVDVRTIGGIGVNWLDNNFQPPRGSSACAADPASSSCTSCAFGTMKSDSACQMTGGVYPNDQTTWAFNDNLRHVHEKLKYGVDLQFPINRYVNGLTSLKVPNRSGEYPSGAGYYQGGLNNDPQDLNCINPLFAQNLPTTSTSPTDPSICNLTPSTTRTPLSSLVYYAHIGGVPYELLTTNNNGVITPKETLSDSDWVSILGTDPQTYNYAGIDPHMIESYQPRMGIPMSPAAAGTAGLTADEGPDWVTDGTAVTRVNLPVDREYACIFKLTTPRNCDPGNAANAESDISSCDCSTAGLAADAVPAVCDTTNPLQQDYAKTYPTIRELLLANLLKGQGIVASLCPIDIVDNAAGNDPNYGYRPAISSIIDRLKSSLGVTCLPETLTETEAGVVPCLVLVTLPSSAGQDETQCDNNPSNPGLVSVDPTVLQEFKNDQAAAYAQSGGSSSQNLSQFTTCEIQQVLPAQFPSGSNTCKANSPPAQQGWCYVTGQGSCPQSLVFTTKGLPPEGIVSLQCLENSSDFASGNGTGGGTSSSTATSSSSSGGATTH
jgi:hypothetical protein